MLSDEEFYAEIQPHLRAKSAGQRDEITPKDASATRSNGEKDSEGVTESIGPNGPILSIVVRTRGSQVPAAERSSMFRGNGERWMSSEQKGWAWPVMVQDSPESPVDGAVMLMNGVADKVKMSEAKFYKQPVYRGYSETFALALESINFPDKVKYVITFDGYANRDGTFTCKDSSLDELASDWAVRWMVRKEHGR